MSDKDFISMTPRGLTVLGLAATLTLSACGGGGGGGGGGGAPLPPKLKLSNFQPAAVVIGQADFAGIRPNQNGAPDANTLQSLYGNPAVSDSGTLFIGDYGNHRVLAYNTIPTVNNAVADFVLGQPDFTTTEQGTFDGPQQISIAGGKMAVADYDLDRVLIYNTVPAGAGVEPDVVVGKSGFSSDETHCDAVHVTIPETVEVTPNGKLVVTDSEHHRVLIWNSFPTTNFQPADVVLGQSDFAHYAPNDDDQDGSMDSAASARVMISPTGVRFHQDKLLVSDEGANRVLVFQSQ